MGELKDQPTTKSASCFTLFAICDIMENALVLFHYARKLPFANLANLFLLIAPIGFLFTNNATSITNLRTISWNLADAKTNSN